MRLRKIRIIQELKLTRSSGFASIIWQVRVLKRIKIFWRSRLNVHSSRFEHFTIMTHLPHCRAALAPTQAGHLILILKILYQIVTCNATRRTICVWSITLVLTIRMDRLRSLRRWPVIKTSRGYLENRQSLEFYFVFGSELPREKGRYNQTQRQQLDKNQKWTFRRVISGSSLASITSPVLISDVPLA